MLFNSVPFLLFFVAVFALYWSLGRSARMQNVLLLLAGSFFYGWADPRFLFLLLASAAVNYALGIAIERHRDRPAGRWLLWLGVALNLGVLAYFKYADFFLAGFVDVVNVLGGDMSHRTLGILLPVGISFFTFQTLGYLIDVHNEEMDASRDPLAFFTYVFYFPKLLAGPIERAQKFLPQVATKRIFDPVLAVDGCRQILWGLFAKVVIADNCTASIDLIFEHSGTETGSTLLLGAFLHIVQMYCDFSGYSNIALGVSKLLGIRLMVNFSTPFFATNISDFWKRWHISLTTWMMEHVFTPLTFVLRQYGRLGLVISITITFLAVGIWHGGTWNFVLFGTLQSLYFIPLALSKGVDRSSTFPADSKVPSLRQVLQMAGIFTLMMFTFILLRAESVPQAGSIVAKILSPSLFMKMGVLPKGLLLTIAGFMLVEWLHRGRQHGFDLSGARWPRPLRLAAYYVLVGMVLWNGGTENQFIYFQF